MTGTLSPSVTLGAVALLTAALAIAIAAHPNAVRGRVGKIVALVAFFLLPVVLTSAGARVHLQHAKSTEFCLSCHVMEPYGRSLQLADTDFVPATHYQNHLVDAEYACYTCHTSYTMYGDLESKIRGLRHVWRQYVGPLPETIELYEPYHNRECLHCHAGARRFEENELHADDREALATNEVSCLECHDLAHAVDELDGAETWSAPTT